jgi:hypothetical protein
MIKILWNYSFWAACKICDILYEVIVALGDVILIAWNISNTELRSFTNGEITPLQENIQLVLVLVSLAVWCGILCYYFPKEFAEVRADLRNMLLGRPETEPMWNPNRNARSSVAALNDTYHLRTSTRSRKRNSSRRKAAAKGASENSGRS